MRKTHELANLKAIVNAQILNLADDHVIARQVAASVLEQVLHQAGAYQGFQYLDSNDMKASQHGTTVGINEHTHEDDWNTKFDGTDRSRVKYF